MGTQSRLFGTDGIRGCANAEPLTPELAMAFGRAVAAKFGQRGKRILIGRDTRISGPMLESAVRRAIAAMGYDVGLLGICDAGDRLPDAANERERGHCHQRLAQSV